jgi:hypothetical protein
MAPSRSAKNPPDDDRPLPHHLRRRRHPLMRWMGHGGSVAKLNAPMFLSLLQFYCYLNSCLLVRSLQLLLVLLLLPSAVSLPRRRCIVLVLVTGAPPPSPAPCGTGPGMCPPAAPGPRGSPPRGGTPACAPATPSPALCVWDGSRDAPRSTAGNAGGPTRAGGDGSGGRSPRVPDACNGWLARWNDICRCDSCCPFSRFGGAVAASTGFAASRSSSPWSWSSCYGSRTPRASTAATPAKNPPYGTHRLAILLPVVVVVLLRQQDPQGQHGGDAREELAARDLPPQDPHPRGRGRRRAAGPHLPGGLLFLDHRDTRSEPRPSCLLGNASSLSRRGGGRRGRDDRGRRDR